MLVAARKALARAAERVHSPEDSDELRLHKTLLIFACGLMGFAAMLWLAIYNAMGIRYSSTVPLLYMLVSATTLGIYLWNLNFEFFRFAQTCLYLFVPFIMQWSIGSYVTSSGVMLWALLAPIGVMVFQGAKESVPWFFAYIVMTAVSGFFDYYIAYGADRATGLPLHTIAVFFVLNFAAMSTIVYLLVSYFVREKDRLKDALDARNAALKTEQQRSEKLLLNVLPGRIAERLKNEPGLIVDSIADCTVMFADLTDFTRLAEETPAREMLVLLNDLFSWFDNLADQYGLEKIKTIGVPTWWRAGCRRRATATPRRSRAWRWRCATASASAARARAVRLACTSASAPGRLPPASSACTSSSMIFGATR